MLLRPLQACLVHVLSALGVRDEALGVLVFHLGSGRLDRESSLICS